MCWIIISTKPSLSWILSHQKDRGLDSVWVLSSENMYKATKEGLDWYNNFIDRIEDDRKLYILHHRKATIWEINIDNAHPFIWAKYTLVQNWTVRLFNVSGKEDYGQDVDSHNLLHLIEDFSNTLEEVPKVMKQFKKVYKDEFGIVILVDKDWRILFISDGARESYIETFEWKVLSISNYETWTIYWYKNSWYILFEFDWTILSSKFETELNTTPFKEKAKYSCALPAKSEVDYLDDYDDTKYANRIPEYNKKRKNKKIKGGVWAFVTDEVSAIYEYITNNQFFFKGLSASDCIDFYLSDNYWYKSLTQFAREEGFAFPVLQFKNIFNNKIWE